MLGVLMYMLFRALRPVSSPSGLTCLRSQSVSSSGSEAKRELEDLSRLISQHDDNYYGGYEKPVWPDLDPISDDEYDALVRRAAHLEQLHPDLQGMVRRLGGVGSPIKGNSAKVVHTMPMLSLDNAFTLSEVEKFLTKLSVNGNPQEVVLEPKIDGLSLSLLYSNGQLVRAASRGDGAIGEDLTLNAKEIVDLPERITPPSHFPKHLEVRGEVYIDKASFERLNAMRKLNNETGFSTARNTAAGSLRQDDPSVTRERGLRFFAYSIHGLMRKRNEYYFSESESQKIRITSQSQCLSKLSELSFSVAKPWHLCDAWSIADIYKLCKEYESNREELEYDVDGVVIKVRISISLDYFQLVLR